MSFHFLESVLKLGLRSLTGAPDGLISKSQNQLYITAPVIVLVEAKKGDLGDALAQCIAEMEAARIFNERKGQEISILYGVVSDGALWQFLSLSNNIASIDIHQYSFGNGSQIVAILKSFL